MLHFEATCTGQIQASVLVVQASSHSDLQGVWLDKAFIELDQVQNVKTHKCSTHLILLITYNSCNRHSSAK